MKTTLLQNFLCLACLAWTAWATPAAELPEPSPTGASVSTNGAIAVTAPGQLAAWQQHLTLGPGDVLNVSLYQHADSERSGLAIGPDGRLNYLQARDVMAAGLTVEELRAVLEEILVKYYLSPRVVIVPAAYRSKKYYILGNVTQKGVFPLDRPITIVEAIANAHGFATTTQQRNTMLMADLSHSFLIRKGRDGRFDRVPVNFEGLFLEGDLSQNIAVAPDDYLYFPPLDLKEVYIFGDVVSPGVSVYTPQTTVLRAIIGRGGFADTAWKSKVLVVRGSLNHPETFVVNTGDVLAARQSDFRLQPGDIVYVNRKPWSKAEELLGAAILDFTRAAIITWTGQNVGPIITEPIF